MTDSLNKTDLDEVEEALASAEYESAAIDALASGANVCREWKRIRGPVTKVIGALKKIEWLNDHIKKARVLIERLARLLDAACP